jgi:hypothetical protein
MPWTNDSVFLQASASELAAFVLSADSPSAITQRRLRYLIQFACPEQGAPGHLLGKALDELEPEAEIDALYQQLANEHDDEVFARLRDLQQAEANRLVDAVRKSMPAVPGEISKALNDVRKRLDAYSSKDDETAR